jgi:hypothetical protein
VIGYVALISRIATICPVGGESPSAPLRHYLLVCQFALDTDRLPTMIRPATSFRHIVDAADYTVWRNNLSAGSGGLAAVPEPQSIW